MKLADGVTFYPRGRMLKTEGGQPGLIFFEKSWSLSGFGGRSENSQFKVLLQKVSLGHTPGSTPGGQVAGRPPIWKVEKAAPPHLPALTWQGAHGPSGR